jgi:hypothetical protein
MEIATLLDSPMAVAFTHLMEKASQRHFTLAVPHARWAFVDWMGIRQRR